MALVSTTIKMDSALKQEAQELLESFGLNLSTAVNMFLRQVVREQAIPFRIGDPIPNAETLQAIENVQNGVGLSREFNTVEALLEELNADD